MGDTHPSIPFPTSFPPSTFLSNQPRSAYRLFPIPVQCLVRVCARSSLQQLADADNLLGNGARSICVKRTIPPPTRARLLYTMWMCVYKNCAPPTSADALSSSLDSTQPSRRGKAMQAICILAADSDQKPTAYKIRGTIHWLGKSMQQEQ